MVAKKISLSSFVVCFVVFLSLVEVFEFRGVDSFFLEGFRPYTQRRIFDTSCKGLYDRSLFAQLDSVCDDCHNLFRKPRVGAECRRNCFQDEMFPYCVRHLGLDVDEYIAKVRIIATD